MRAVFAAGPGGLAAWPVLPEGDALNPAKGTYFVGDRLPMKGSPSISRADVADFMYKAAQSPEWIHRDAVITD